MKLRLAALSAVILLSACRHTGDVTAENGGGIYSVRSACPIAGVPAEYFTYTIECAALQKSSPSAAKPLRYGSNCRLCAS